MRGILGRTVHMTFIKNINAPKRIRLVVNAGILGFTLILLSVAGTVQAQSESAPAQAVEVPQALGPDAMSALVSKLDENQTAALVELVTLLNTSADLAGSMPAEDKQNVVAIIKGWLTGFAANFKNQLQAFPEMFSSLGESVAVIFKGRDMGGSLWFLLMFAISVAVGMAAEWFFNRLTREKRDRIRQAQPVALMETLKVLSARAGIEIGGVLVFAAGALIATNVILSAENDLFLVTAFILNVIVLVRIVGSVLHFILAPRRPELRLVYTDTWTAQFMERNFKLLASLVGVGFFLMNVMLQNGITGTDTFRFWVGLSVHVWLVFIILKSTRGLTQIIEGGDENLTPGLKRMAAWWPYVSAGFVAFNWIFLQFVLSTGHDALTPQRSASAIALIVMVPFLDTIVRGIAAHMVPTDNIETEVMERAYNETRLSYIRIGRIALVGTIIAVVGKLWGINLRNLTEAGFGAQVAANVVSFLLIIAIGYLAWEITNLVISRRLAKEVPEGGEEGAEGGTGQTRMATILPILRMTLQVTIIIITVLLALSQLGFNITPLLAGAGVLGLAIGFGAQTLVKDVVSGVFFLLDDAFRLGEFITVGTTNGVVSKISVRSLQLRQDTGQLHIIPYGSMSQLTNNSRDWVTMKLKFTVPFDTDQEKVRKLFKKIGQEMMEEPELAEVLINPFKSQGAADVTDVGIVIRGKFSTVPGGQFIIRKEVYNRVQRAFEENGIEFARKEVRVQLPESVKPSDLNEDQKKALSAGASQGAENPA